MMQDAWRDKWQPRNVFPSSRPATSVLGVSLAINPLENRWPIKSRVQGEPSLINADCQGASLMYFSFKESVSNAHRFFVFFWHFFSLSLLRLVRREQDGRSWNGGTAQSRDSRFFCFYGLRCLLALGSRKSDGAALWSAGGANVLIDVETSHVRWSS